jgi:hypothetical protein
VKEKNKGRKNEKKEKNKKILRIFHSYSNWFTKCSFIVTGAKATVADLGF